MRGDVVPPSRPALNDHPGDVPGGDVPDGQGRVVSEAFRPVQRVHDEVLAEATVQAVDHVVDDVLEGVGQEMELGSDQFGVGDWLAVAGEQQERAQVCHLPHGQDPVVGAPLGPLAIAQVGQEALVVVGAVEGPAVGEPGVALVVGLCWVVNQVDFFPADGQHEALVEGLSRPGQVVAGDGQVVGGLVHVAGQRAPEPEVVVEPVGDAPVGHNPGPSSGDRGLVL